MLSNLPFRNIFSHMSFEIFLHMSFDLPNSKNCDKNKPDAATLTLHNLNQLKRPKTSKTLLGNLQHFPPTHKLANLRGGGLSYFAHCLKSIRIGFAKHSYNISAWFAKAVAKQPKNMYWFISFTSFFSQYEPRVLKPVTFPCKGCAPSPRCSLLYIDKNDKKQ